MSEYDEAAPARGSGRDCGGGVEWPIPEASPFPSVRGPVASVRDFEQLQLSEGCQGELARLGVGSPRELGRLAVLVLGELPSDEPSRIPSAASVAVRRIGEELYAKYVVPEVCHPTLALDLSDEGVTFSFSVDTSALWVRSKLSIASERSALSLDCGGVPFDVEFHGFLTACADPLSDLRGLLADTADGAGAGRDRQRMSAREGEVLARRFGLDGMPKATLSALAAEAGVTRERIRQIESRCLRLLDRQRSRRRLNRLADLVEGMALDLETAGDAPLLAKEFAKRFPGAVEPVGPWLRLLSAIQRSGGRWGHLQTASYDGLRGSVSSALAQEGELTVSELLTQVADELSVEASPGLMARIAALDFCEVDGMSVRLASGVASPHLQRMRAITDYFRRNGAAHFSAVAEGIAPMLGESARMSARNVHAWLDRNQEVFAWVGPGTFRLRQEGDAAKERESLPAKYAPSRRRGIGDAIVRLLLEQQPRSLEEIESHILPHFAVNKGSVSAAILQDRAGRFLMTDGRQVFLHDADLDAFEAERPRVAGLIDWGEVATELADFSEEAE
jgi:hypothetical protein